MTKEEAFNETMKLCGLDMNKISDGYHKFEELYEHRIAIYIALCKVINRSNYRENDGWDESPVWRSQCHSDGSIWDGWFILGVEKKQGHQITYHLPLSKWEETNFAKTLEKAPDYDGHTSNDVLERLKSI